MLKVVGHPASSAARLRIVYLNGRFCRPYHQNLWQKLCSKFKTSLAASELTCYVRAGTSGYWQQMKTTEDLQGLEFS